MFDSGINVVSPCYVLSLCGQNRQGRRTASGSRFPRPTQGADTAPYFHFHTALFRPNFQKSNTYFVGFRFRYTGNLHGVLPTLMPALNRFGNAVPDIFNRGTVRAHHSRNGLRHRRFRCGPYLFFNRRRIVMLIGRSVFRLLAAAARGRMRLWHLDEEL